jgi:hypothetical protein
LPLIFEDENESDELMRLQSKIDSNFLLEGNGGGNEDTNKLLLLLINKIIKLTKITKEHLDSGVNSSYIDRRGERRRK